MPFQTATSAQSSGRAIPNQAYTTSTKAPIVRQPTESVTPRVPFAPTTPVLASASPAEMPGKMPGTLKENSPMNDHFRAAAAKSKIRVRSPGPRKTAKEQPESLIETMISTYVLPEHVKRFESELSVPEPSKTDLMSNGDSEHPPLQPEVGKSLASGPAASCVHGESVKPRTVSKAEAGMAEVPVQSMSHDSPSQVQKTLKEDTVVSSVAEEFVKSPVIHKSKASALEVLVQEMGQTPPSKALETLNEDPANSIARIRSEMQAYKLEIIAAFDQWDARLVSIEQSQQKTTQPSEPMMTIPGPKIEPEVNKSQLSTSTTTEVPPGPAKPSYTAKELKALRKHVTIKVRFGTATQSYRVNEDDTVGTVLRNASFDFEPIAGRLGNFYLRLGETDLNSRWKLKDIDVVEGDVLDVVQDAQGLNSQWKLRNEQDRSGSAIKKKYGDALRMAAKDFTGCNDCGGPFTSEFRGAPEDPSICHLALNCTKCGNEQIR
ncbi:hypothetical protein MBLNU457_5594t1 [Dothideomycetes sp. NU457]